MKKFVLINSGILLVHVYGVIEALDADDAAIKIGSKVMKSTRNGTLEVRYLLENSRMGFFGRNVWFLEELKPLASRPERMDDSL